MSDLPEEDDKPAGGGWLVSYADLMTLLFAAFVVLYGITPQGKSDDLLGVLSRIREAFIEVPDIIPDEERVGPIKSGLDAFRYFKGDQMNPPIIKRYRRSENVLNIINDDLQQVKALLDIQNKKRIEGLRDPADAPFTVHEEPDGFRLRLLASALYEPGSYRLSQDSMKKVNEIASLLKDIGRPITIEGHTDNAPPKGMSNWELSSLRAGYLANHFIGTIGMSSKDISTAGYADIRPMATNETSAGRSLNRRIEIKVHYE